MPHRLGRILCYYLVLPLFTFLAVVLCTTIAPATPPRPATTPASTQVLADASLVEQGKALYDAGNFTEAIAILQQAVQTYQRQGDELRQAIALSNLALAYQQLGQWQAAEQAIADSLALLGTPEATTGRIQPYTQQNLPVLAQILMIRGHGQLEQGQPDPAIATWQQVESIYQKLGNVSGIAQSQINQAQALRVLGYYRRALLLLTDLGKTLQTQADSVLKVVELRSLGNALRLVGDPDQSEAVLRQSLAIIQRLPQSPETALELSAIWFSLGNTARAKQAIPTAITCYQTAAELASNPLNRVQAQINLYSLLVTQGQLAAAQPLLSDIQTELATLPPSQAKIYAQVHFAQSLMSVHENQSNQSHSQASSSSQLAPPSDAKTAAQLLATAVRSAQDLGDRRAEAYALGNLGHIYEQTDQWHQAQALTQQALTITQAINAPDIAYRWHWQLGRLLKQQGQISEATTAYDAAVNTLKFLRQDLAAVNQEVQFSFRETVEPVYRESVELLVQTSDNAPTEQRLDQARARIEALQLAELDNFFREACLDNYTVSLDNVVQNHPTAAVIYPIILPNQLAVIVKIPRQPLHYHTIAIPKQEVEALLQQLQQNLTELDATAKIQAQSQQVYRWLLEPIKSDLDQQGVNTLVFVLDGAFRRIPMAGLYDGQHYLIESYAIALSLGLQLLPPKALTTAPLHVLAAGLMEPPPPFQQQFSPLPAIKSEFDRITQAGAATQQLLNQAFTSVALEAKVSSAGFNVVHLATHGQFSSQAKDTFILAADGPINVTQLDSLLRQRRQSRATAIELLVLSACQTAEGDDRATLGLAGVAVKAGARSTLASLWHIDDRSTAILMGEFYRELAHSKVTKAEALRRAQIALIKNYPNYERPGYWAAYVLVGNWL